MGFSTIIYEKGDFITRIILNRPEVRNAIDFQMVDEIIHPLKQAEADDEVRVVVITGSGETFCAGMDLKSASTDASQGLDRYNELWYSDLTNILHTLGKPVIAISTTYMGTPVERVGRYVRHRCYPRIR